MRTVALLSLPFFKTFVASVRESHQSADFSFRQNSQKAADFGANCHPITLCERGNIRVRLFLTLTIECQFQSCKCMYRVSPMS